MCATCDPDAFLKEIAALRKDPAFAWCGTLTLLKEEIKATGHVTPENRQYLADVRRRAVDPGFAAAYGQPPPPNLEAEAAERTLAERREALLAQAAAQGWPALGEPVPIRNKRGEVTGTHLPLQGEAPWRYAVHACHLQ